MTDEILGRLKRFKHGWFPRFRRKYRELVEGGQHPTTLFIGCSDSRIVPHLLTDAGPGELFVVRNAGNLIPPYETGGEHHGTAASIEFAVLGLKVRDIVVCGHSHCGAIKALYTGVPPESRHMGPWFDLARDAALPVAEVTDEALRRTEQRSIVLQLERLADYPMVRDRIERGELFLHGWHYVIEEGTVSVLDIETGAFATLEDASAKADAEHLRGVNFLQ